MPRLSSVSATQPVPLGGWNAKDPLEAMPPTDAVRLVNLFPNTGSLDLRSGFAVHATGVGSTAVQTVAEFASETGTRKLIACANGDIYDASSAGAATNLSAAIGAFTNNKWQTVNFRQRLIMVNGQDEPQHYDGTILDVGARPFYTGVTETTLKHVHVFKSRLYFVQASTASIWYGGVNNLKGALTQFDVQSLLKLGGYISWLDSWSRDTGVGPNELLVICSNLGEVLVYSGDNPGAANWTLVSQLFLPVPLGEEGRRSKLSVGPDIIVMTQQGIVPLSQVLLQGNISGAEVKLSDKIQNAFNTVAGVYQSNFGWQMVNYPKNYSIYVNIPIAPGTTSEQYVVNTLTGSWTRFTGMNASSWTLFNEALYFGGMDGKVYKADSGQADNGNFISVDMKTAFNYFGDHSQLKQFVLAKPLVNPDSDVEFMFDIDVDFKDTASSSTITYGGATGSAWDTSPWDTSAWGGGNPFLSNWASVAGIGQNAALKLKGQYKNVDFSISSFQVVFKPGGYL